MPRPLLGGGGGSIVCATRRKQLIHSQRANCNVNIRNQLSSPDQLWNVVIQFSARHLFCPSHALVSTPAILTRGTRRAAIANYSTQRQILSAKRQLSALAFASDPSSLISTYPSESRRRDRSGGQLMGQDIDNSYNTSESAAQSTVTSETHASCLRTQELVHTISSTSKSQSSNFVFIKSDSDTIDTTSPKVASSIPKLKASSHGALSLPLPNPTSSKPTKNRPMSWEFPIPDSFTRTVDHKGDQSTGSVETWISTWNALSGLFRSLHALESSSYSLSPSSSKNSELNTAITYYNFLSQLQSFYNKPLISRRETGRLFKLQGRRPKNRQNLEQLLIITSDLIWLSEKDRQLRRSTNNSVTSKLSASTMPIIRNPTDKFHGLRVSEYTILMSWMGSVVSGLENSPSSHHPTHQQLQKKTIRPIDRVWSIWQDFLLTGMKPDVVLCTVLMEALLEAKEYDRADQIWEYMNRHSPNRGPKTRKEKRTAALDVLDSMPKSLNDKQLSASENTHTSIRMTNNSMIYKNKSTEIDILDCHQTQQKTLQDENGGNLPEVSEGFAPNIQTFSVLMEAHVSNRDLQGAMQTYREFIQSTSSGSLYKSDSRDKPGIGSQQRSDTILLNQILRILDRLGESNAAKDIAAVIDQAQVATNSENPKEDQSPDRHKVDDGSSSLTNPIENSPGSELMSGPIHHLKGQNRSKWTKRRNRTQWTKTKDGNTSHSSSARQKEFPSLPSSRTELD